MSGDDLYIVYGERDDIKVNSQNSKHNIERVELSDGSYLTNDDINRIIQSVNSYISEKGLDIRSDYDIRKYDELMQIATNAWHH